MSTVFSVKTSVFEGPLDLLLNLIEERKLLISDVSLSEVADAFLTYISAHDAFPLQDTAQFLVVASTLLLLKSRALLPVLELTNDEEGDISTLERRLKMLQIIREATKNLVSKSALHVSTAISVRNPLFVPPRDVTLTALNDAIQRVYEAIPKAIQRDEVRVAPVISLDEMIDRLTIRVQQALKLSFAEVSKGVTDPREIVVGFLAVLELVKRGFADVTQTGHFEEITIAYNQTNTPRYE